MSFGSILSGIQRPFKFAVVGDAHFTSPEFRRVSDRDVQLSGGMTAGGYIENVNLVLSPMMETLVSQSPAFIVMTGDLVAGGLRKALRRAELKACLRFFDAFDLPLLPARGDRDESDAFADIALPYLSRRMGWERSMPYYFTDVAGCRLVVFDTGSWTPGCNQLGWFQELMRACGEARIDRVFVFGHLPKLARAPLIPPVGPREQLSGRAGAQHTPSQENHLQHEVADRARLIAGGVDLHPVLDSQLIKRAGRKLQSHGREVVGFRQLPNLSPVE